MGEPKALWELWTFRWLLWVERQSEFVRAGQQVTFYSLQWENTAPPTQMHFCWMLGAYELHLHGTIASITNVCPQNRTTLQYDTSGVYYLVSSYDTSHFPNSSHAPLFAPIILQPPHVDLLLFCLLMTGSPPAVCVAESLLMPLSPSCLQLLGAGLQGDAQSYPAASFPICNDIFFADFFPSTIFLPVFFSNLQTGNMF